MLLNSSPLRYFASLEKGKLILWCYLIWNLVTLFNYFDPSPVIWLNSFGISVVIGFGLLLSVSNSGLKITDRWQTFRLFLMPICFSSFSSPIKGHGFILIATPSLAKLVFSVICCATFVVFVLKLKPLKLDRSA